MVGCVCVCVCERHNFVKMFEEKSKFLKSKKNIGKIQPAVGLTDA